MIVAMTSHDWTVAMSIAGTLALIVAIVALIDIQRTKKVNRVFSDIRLCLYIVLIVITLGAAMLCMLLSISAEGRESQRVYRKADTQRIKDDNLRLARSKPARESAAKRLRSCWPGATIDPKLIELGNGSQRSSYTLDYPDGSMVIVRVPNNSILGGPCKK